MGVPTTGLFYFFLLFVIVIWNLSRTLFGLSHFFV